MSDILVSTADSTLATALEANFTQQYTYFRKAPQATVCDDDTITWVVSGIPIAEYNAVTERGQKAPVFQAGDAWRLNPLTDRFQHCYTPCSGRDVQLVGGGRLHTNTAFFSRRTGAHGDSARATGA